MQITIITEINFYNERTTLMDAHIFNRIDQLLQDEKNTELIDYLNKLLHSEDMKSAEKEARSLIIDAKINFSASQFNTFLELINQLKIFGNKQFFFTESKNIAFIDAKNLKDPFLGAQRYLKMVNNKEYTVNDCLDANEKFNIKTIFKKINKLYEVQTDKVNVAFDLVNLTQFQLKASIAISSIPNNNPIVFVDDMLENTFVSSLFAAFLNSLDKQKFGRFAFQFLLYTINEECIGQKLPGEDGFKELINYIQISDNDNLVNFVTDCYFAMLAFVLGHELAHFYLNHKSNNLTIEEHRRQEYEADEAAYLILLKLIEDDQSTIPEERVFYPHAYLAPVMLFDYFDIIYFTERTIYDREREIDGTHPSLLERSSKLIDLSEQKKVSFNKEAGQILCSAYYSMCDSYKIDLNYNKQHHLIDNIIEKNRKR